MNIINSLYLISFTASKCHLIFRQLVFDCPQDHEGGYIKLPKAIFLKIIGDSGVHVQNLEYYYHLYGWK